ncbi:hypothetical protein [Sulfitobacter sp. S190]|uniref:hypothetical protein n=1 Tax=Sulfitobacter sp. S190 TaxID=2867022 RepID=UPI0021A93041|nr:hypothetical protein [Sulfitobacter sp. S190]UWR23218.1 hypothetical protein K3756_04280 [Sulfitobacter sp. S190]
MARVVTITAVYPRDPELVFAEAMNLSEMKQAMHRIARYEGLPDGVIAQGDCYAVDVVMWGWLRTNNHVMQIETLDWDALYVQSREHNPAVARWDHRLSITPHEAGALWTDEIVLDAGWRTALTAYFCRYVYRHRHRSRDALSIKCTIAAA